MKKKYQSLIAIFSLFFVVAVVISCRKNDFGSRVLSSNNLHPNGSNVSDGIISELQAYYKSKVVSVQKGDVITASNGSKTHFLSPNWKDVKYKQLLNGDEIITASAQDFKILGKGISYYRFYAFKEINGNVYRGEIIEVYSKTDSITNLNSITAGIRSHNIPGFNGSIIVYDLNYDYKRSQVYNNGVLVEGKKSFTKSSPISETKQINSTSNLRVTSTKLLDEDTGGGGGGGYDPANQGECLRWFYYEYNDQGDVLYFQWLGTTGNCGDDNNPPPGNPNGDGGGPAAGPTDTTSCVYSVPKININGTKVIVFAPACMIMPLDTVRDSIRKKDPCLNSLVLNKLKDDGIYTTLIAPFMNVGMRPNITWDIRDDLQWGNGTYALAHTQPDPHYQGSTDQLITINQHMLDNSSALMVAAACIHEQFHAYIQYQIANSEVMAGNGYLADTSWTNENKDWAASLNHYLSMKDVPGNYNDHTVILMQYFINAVDCLMTWDNFQHTDKEYKEAMLFGLDTSDPQATQQQNNALQSLYDSVRTGAGISQSDLQTFYQNNVTNAPSNKKLPQSGC